MTKIEIKKNKNSEIEIIGEIAEKEFESYRKDAVTHLGKELEVDGFRKGHVPENIIESKLSDMLVLEEMAHRAISKEYPTILADNKIDAIGRPEISLTKLAKNNPLGFTIRTAVMPEITLPDYASIAKKIPFSKESTDATDEDIENTILQIRRMRAQSQAQAQAKQKEKEKKEEGTPTPPAKIEDKDLPPLDDEHVKSLGNFKDVADFKIQLKENIKKEKETKENDKRRLKIIDGIIEKSTVEVPQLLVNMELDKMLHQLKGDIANSGLTFEDYLKHLKKEEADIRKDWEKDARKRAEVSLIISKIALAENIKADEKEVEHQLKHLLEHHKGADPQGARAYIENILINKKVFAFLEDQK
ncbi:hypothetical protein COB64_01430 [Candidatus Wolfebacteria bacterium]|nr:MAG: hypothetical protein COB64_01430 [Candidatus Wolfebacteria bacterium]